LKEDGLQTYDAVTVQGSRKRTSSTE